MTLTLEQQVSSLKSSQLLEKLGCPQKSLFYWVKVEYDEKYHLSMFKKQTDFNTSSVVYDGIGISSHGAIEIEDSIVLFTQ